MGHSGPGLGQNSTAAVSPRLAPPMDEHKRPLTDQWQICLHWVRQGRFHAPATRISPRLHTAKRNSSTPVRGGGGVGAHNVAERVVNEGSSCAQVNTPEGLMSVAVPANTESVARHPIQACATCRTSWDAGGAPGASDGRRLCLASTHAEDAEAWASPLASSKSSGPRLPTRLIASS